MCFSTSVTQLLSVCLEVITIVFSQHNYVSTCTGIYIYFTVICSFFYNQYSKSSIDWHLLSSDPAKKRSQVKAESKCYSRNGQRANQSIAGEDQQYSSIPVRPTRVPTYMADSTLYTDRQDFNWEKFGYYTAAFIRAYKTSSEHLFQY